MLAGGDDKHDPLTRSAIAPLVITVYEIFKLYYIQGFKTLRCAFPRIVELRVEEGYERQHQGVAVVLRAVNDALAEDADSALVLLGFALHEDLVVRISDLHDVPYQLADSRPGGENPAFAEPRRWTDTNGQSEARARSPVRTLTPSYALHTCLFLSSPSVLSSFPRRQQRRRKSGQLTD